jgi:glycosyltransferase involved in cell wall biosynthesis
VVQSAQEITTSVSAEELPSFCVVLPVYNEAAVVASCIDRIAHFLKDVPARTAIIAVDDGSSDDSYNIIKQLSQRLPQLIVYRHECNSGYGAANRTLCRLAVEHGFEYAVVMDADGTQDPLFIANFFPLMRNGFDFIKATRYRRGGRVKGVPWRRYIVSRIGNLLAQLFMNIPLSDFSNGFRAIRTEKWQQFDTTEPGFELLIEECYYARKLGLSFGEVPYVLTVRGPGSESKFSYRWKVYLNYLRYVFKR